MNQSKFTNKLKTAKDEDRAFVNFENLTTLWLNSGTLCNLSCDNCYIESSPTNDRLEYLTLDDVTPFLEEIRTLKLNTSLIGITGGEPFLNPHLIQITESILKYSIDVLILTNAVRVIDKYKSSLIKLNELFPGKLKIRVSLDHYTKEIHENERGANTFNKALENVKWLSDNNFDFSIAGRSLINEGLEDAKIAYQDLLTSFEIDKNLINENKLVIFPEMELDKDVPEITTKCWDILNINPGSMMCATERMVIKNKGEEKAILTPCTLLAYDKSFYLGNRIQDSMQKTYLNHKFCAQFCVLGGASCSSTK